MPGPRVSPERRHILSVSLRSQNARQHFTRATLCKNLEGKCWAQSDSRTQTHTLCASLRNMFSCTSTFHKSRLCARIYRDNAGAQSEPRMQTHTLCEPAQWKCTWRFHLCEPAQWKCTWRFHKIHFIRNFTGKRPRTSWSTMIKHRSLPLP